MDRGCAEAILRKKNVYAAGITSFKGSFGHMDAVSILSDGVEIARGLLNYSSEVCNGVIKQREEILWHES